MSHSLSPLPPPYPMALPPPFLLSANLVKSSPAPLALPNVPTTPPPVHLPVTMSVFLCTFGWAVSSTSAKGSCLFPVMHVQLGCLHMRHHSLLFAVFRLQWLLRFVFFFLSQKTLRGNNTVTLQTQWMEMNLNHLHVLSG